MQPNPNPMQHTCPHCGCQSPVQPLGKQQPTTIPYSTNAAGGTYSDPNTYIVTSAMAGG